MYVFKTHLYVTYSIIWTECFCKISRKDITVHKNKVAEGKKNEHFKTYFSLAIPILDWHIMTGKHWNCVSGNDWWGRVLSNSVLYPISRFSYTLVCVIIFLLSYDFILELYMHPVIEFLVVGVNIAGGPRDAIWKREIFKVLFLLRLPFFVSYLIFTPTSAYYIYIVCITNFKHLLVSLLDS